MAKSTGKKDHSDTIIFIVIGVIILLLIWWFFNSGTSASTPESSPAPLQVLTIPQASPGSPSPLGSGTVNVTWTNQPSTDGIQTYIPLFGFLRYGAFFG
jgi:hypothetical protein